MKKSILKFTLLLTSLISACQSNWQEDVLREVKKAEAKLSELEGSGKVIEQFDLLSEDYVYIDISGKRVTKAQLVARREEDHRI
ncbi:MAG: hypothetical protein ACR2MX_15755, partial [Cyclobacteriaceae bacterium]